MKFRLFILLIVGLFLTPSIDALAHNINESHEHDAVAEANAAKKDEAMLREDQILQPLIDGIDKEMGSRIEKDYEAELAKEKAREFDRTRAENELTAYQRYLNSKNGKNSPMTFLEWKRHVERDMDNARNYGYPIPFPITKPIVPIDLSEFFNIKKDSGNCEDKGQTLDEEINSTKEKIGELEAILQELEAEKAKLSEEDIKETSEASDRLYESQLREKATEMFLKWLGNKDIFISANEKERMIQANIEKLRAANWQPSKAKINEQKLKNDIRRRLVKKYGKLDINLESLLEMHYIRIKDLKGEERRAALDLIAPFDVLDKINDFKAPAEDSQLPIIDKKKADLREELGNDIRHERQLKAAMEALDRLADEFRSKYSTDWQTSLRLRLNEEEAAVEEKK